MRVVILATRISGNDGVSLEAVRWKEILQEMGHTVTFVAGALDRGGILIPELHFQSRKVVEVHDKVVYGKENYRKVEKEIFTIAGSIEGKLREVFNSGKKCDLLIVPNVFSLPVHFPLAVALARVIEEKKIPTIARHHDFWWERDRFLRSSMFHFFSRWFPPKLPSVKHVVINSRAKNELQRRTGLSSEVISDSFDFDSKRNKLDEFSRKFREDFGISKTDIVFLQATRIVERKRIELSIELVRRLDDPRIVLVVAGKDGDEKGGYERKIRLLAKEAGIRHAFLGTRINSRRKIVNGKRIYTLWDAFVNSDFVTYPTKIEGFGNQFVEAVYFRKPIILTPYKVYKSDIKPLDFEVIEMPDKVTEGILNQVKNLIDNKDKRKKMVERNFEIGRKNFSYQATGRKIKGIIKRL